MKTERNNSSNGRPVQQQGASPIRLVCFDWGGVILRHCRGWAEGCAAAGLSVRFDPTEPEGLARRREAHRLHQTGRIGHEDFLTQLREATGNLYTRDELAHLHDAWLLDEYPGVREVIERLVRTLSVETALLSNTNEAHWVTHLPGPNGQSPRFPTAGLLKHRHASHLMGLVKPDVAIFRDFEERVGHGGRDVLFFDDLEENIAAARSAGWIAEVIDHTGDVAKQLRRHLETHRVWLKQ
jgi:FMN phosphatase YigB (HAD superfamily)